MKKLFAAYMANEDGATAIEYGLIAAGIALAIVISVFAFGDSLDDTFNNMTSSMNNIEAETATAVDPTTAGDN